MSRLLGRPVRVHTVRAGLPAALRWDGRWRQVEKVLETWVYREPWWERSLFAEGPGTPPERTCHRVLLVGGGMVELARCSEDGMWYLQRVFD